MLQDNWRNQKTHWIADDNKELFMIVDDIIIMFLKDCLFLEVHIKYIRKNEIISWFSSLNNVKWG